ncbi:peptidase inhibitor family I36 protein [Streptomyces yokosukanensis]|nr:peptidase inhibitor family I36 protein [Streptomyces yokosukanensis]
MRSLLIMSAPAAALAPAAAPSPQTAAAVPPGHVCFWPEPDQMGAGGAWDYANSWEWAQKFDGVSDTTMGCQPG